MYIYIYIYTYVYKSVASCQVLAQSWNPIRQAWRNMRGHLHVLRASRTHWRWDLVQVCCVPTSC